MKKIMLVLAIAVTGAFAFKTRDEGSISGKITPADGATTAWAIIRTDTLKAPVNDGTFSLQQAKAGTYTVIVTAKSPFQDVTIANVRVEDGKATDLGEIKLAEK
ncbi:carboxypeptidase regulatory-like domain-containing protein [Chitinophaga sancti]|uniref:carboxypeptidase regulatory-like domain-containing protein n=1 Tax=Chitinophaga sancti TaxID=1004 RepID=UPI003F792435